MLPKNIFLILGILIYSASLYGQKLKAIEVPTAVVLAFNKNNSTVVNPEWYKQDNNYQVKYIVNKRPRTATYSNSGTLVVHDDKVALTLIPSGIKEYLDKNYNGKVVDKVLKMTAANGKISYLIEVDGKDLIFDVNGKYLKATQHI